MKSVLNIIAVGLGIYVLYSIFRPATSYQTLENYVNDPNAAAAVALDQGTSLADYSSTIFDNYQIPQDNSGQQLFDTSQLAYTPILGGGQ